MVIGIDASRANAMQRTGTEWYSFFIIRELIENDRDNRYILYVKEPLRDDMRSWAALSHVEVKILRWPPKFLWSLLRLSLEMISRPPDVLFVPAHTIPLIRPRKTVTTCHDIGFERYPELYANTPIGPKGGILKLIFSIFVRITTLGRYANNELNYHRFSMRLAVEKAQRIITISEFSKRELIAHYQADPAKISVIYHGVNSDYHPYPKEEIQAVLSKHAISQPYLYFIGRWEHKKNIASLLKAFEILRRTGSKHELVLVGRPGWGFEEAWGAVPADIRSHIRLLQGVGPEAPLIMAGADVFVFPSLYEGFGMPIIEAMRAGVPVVSSDAASLPEAAHGAALCVDAKNPKVLASAIENVISDPRKRADLIAKGAARAEQFSWKKAGKETHHIIVTA